MGTRVFVEHDAAARQGIGDDDHARAGATVLSSAAEVFARAGLIVKVKEPQPQEWKLLREGRRSPPVSTSPPTRTRPVP